MCPSLRKHSADVELPGDKARLLEIILYQNMLTTHQSATLRSLAEMGHKVTWVVYQEIRPDKADMGWEVPDTGKCHLVVSPTDAQVATVVAESAPDSVHIFGCARWSRLGQVAHRECLQSNRRMGIMSESPDVDGLIGVLRYVKYRVENARFGSDYDFVLAMGKVGADWFMRVGYPASRVHQYMYTTESVSEATQSDIEYTGLFNMIYVGQLIERKRVDLILRAISELGSANVRLTVVGDGHLRGQLTAMSDSLGLSGRIEWTGNLSNTQATATIVQSDLLILPSRFDGWGAVVNEALMRGVPAICSSRCGSSVLLSAEWRGGVFAAGNARSLRTVMARMVSHGKPSPQYRRRIVEWSEHISGQSTAAYLVAVLDHVYNNAPRPVPPWEQGETL